MNPLNLLFVVATIAALAWLARRVRVATRSHRNPPEHSSAPTKSKKRRDHAGIAVGLFMALVGLQASVSGKGGYRTAYSQGLHIQLGGALLLLAAGATIVVSLRTKDR